MGSVPHCSILRESGVKIMKKKILVVDDEKDIVDLITYNLEKEGFSVIKAYDGEKALELIKTHKPN